MTTQIDPNLIARYVYDEATQSIKAKVDATISGAQEVTISHVDDSIKIGDGTNLVSGVRDSSFPVISMNAMVINKYDYVSLTQASTTDTYVFKSGGSGGTTVATVTVTFTDSTKATLSTVVRT